MGRFDFRTKRGEIFNIIQQGFDADTIAFINRVIAAGGSLSATEQNVVNQLVLDLKKYNLWSLMKVIYPMVGASAAACSQNLISSSFRGVFTSGWTFSSTGATPNGTSAYMNTGIIPTTSLNLTSGHMSFYSRTNVESISCDIGSVSAPTAEQAILIRYTGLGFVPIYGVYSTQVANTDSRGLYITNRNSSTNTTGYKNGVNVISTSQSSALSTIPLFISAQNSYSTIYRFSTRQCSFASFGDGLTDAQALDLYNIVQNFQTSLSRQV